MFKVIKQKNKNVSVLPYHEQYNIFWDKLNIADKTILFESMAGERVSGNPLALCEYMMQDARFQDYTFIWAVNNDNIILDEYKNMPDVLFVSRVTDLYLKYLSSAQILIMPMQHVTITSDSFNSA